MTDSNRDPRDSALDDIATHLREYITAPVEAKRAGLVALDRIEHVLTDLRGSSYGPPERVVEIVGEPIVTREQNANRVPYEIADIEERIKLLREASRPTEPMSAYNATRDAHEPTAQGHILSALTKLERRKAELIASKR